MVRESAELCSPMRGRMSASAYSVQFCQVVASSDGSMAANDASKNSLTVRVAGHTKRSVVCLPHRLPARFPSFLLCAEPALGDPGILASSRILLRPET